MFFIIIFIQFIFKVHGQQLESLCPTVFNYGSNEVTGDTWFGNITLKIESNLPGFWLSLLFDKPPIQVQSGFGEVVRIRPLEYVIRKQGIIAAGLTKNLNFSIKFDPSKPVPKLVGIRFTNKVVCPDNGLVQIDLLSSPCPDLFTYEPQTENNKWTGVLQLKSDVFLSEVRVKIILDRKASDLGNWFGEASSTDNKEFVVTNEDVQISPGNTVPLTFFVTYNPNGQIPKLLAFSLNDKFLCGEDRVTKVVAPTKAPTSSGLDVITADWVVGTSSVLDLFADAICGKVSQKAVPLITNATPSEAGEWPWHAAIYNLNKSKRYICGGSLITKFHVLTAGHCIVNKATRSRIDPKFRGVALGKYHLYVEEKTEQFFQAVQIILHPEYDIRKFRNDIGIIKLDRSVEYTDFIRPVCLWRGSIELTAIVNTEGTVFGWGYTENYTASDILLKTNAPVVETTTCIFSNRQFFSQFTNEKNFCAGYKNGTGVCSGDSGGGLMFKNKYGEWEIRGIVSLSTASEVTQRCDTHQYAIFTDVAQYSKWIIDQLKN